MWPIVHFILVAILVLGGLAAVASIVLGTWAVIQGGRMLAALEKDPPGGRP